MTENQQNDSGSVAGAEIWSGRLAFILASIGAAVGLGNIWKFPYTAGSSGGTAFVLVYVLAILVIATPIMLSEMIVGRRGKASAPTALRRVAIEHNASPAWSLLGWMGVFAVVLVLSFYSVIAGWTLAYLGKSASGALNGMTPEQIGQSFDAFLHNPLPMIFWHAVFTGTTVLVISKGVKLGLERVITFLMPALFITLVGLVINSAIVGDFKAAADFLFSADISKVTGPVALAAVGQAFFSVNVGIGAVLTYSAYLPKNVNLFRAAVTISLGDTLVALLAGLAIFPIVFANNLNPGEGPGLIFVTLSSAFATMPGGAYVGSAFFIMIFFAALTSSISMLETMTARATENRNVSRTKAASLIGLTTFGLGLITVFSFSSWEHVYPLGGFKTFATKTPFDLIDYFVSNLVMPIGGVLFALFAGWIISRETQIEELGVGDGWLYKLWLMLTRFVAPIAIAAVLVANL